MSQNIGFDSAWYLSQYPDVAEAHVDPWMHFLAHGRAEGRFPRPSKATSLERALWGAYGDSVVPELLELTISSDEYDARHAHLILLRWFAYREKWHPALSQLQHFLNRHEPRSPSEARLIAEVLGRHEFFDEADRALLGNRDDSSFDDVFSRTNLMVRRSEKNGEVEPSAVVFAISEAFQRSGFLGVQKIDASRAISLDSLRGAKPHAKLSSPHLVSIVVPAYNAERHIASTLDSLLAQTWANIEIIVVDDCSDDSTSEIVKMYALNDHRVKAITLAKNLGAYRARNAGVEVARGSFITVHDSDDWAHPEKVEALVNPLVIDPELAATISSWARVEGDFHFRNWSYAVDVVEKSASTMMYRASVIHAIGRWDEVRIAADSEYLARTCARFGAASVHYVYPAVPLTFARLGRASLTAHPKTNLRTIFHGARQAYSQLAQTWHRMVANPECLALRGDTTERPFPLPIGFDEQVASVGCLVMADFGEGSQTASTNEGLINCLVGKLVDVALCHCPGYETHEPIAKHYMEFAVEDFVRLVVGEPTVRAKCFVVIGSATLRRLPAVLPRMEFQSFFLVDGSDDIDKVAAYCHAGITIETSDFCPDWYRSANPDVASSGVDPWTHYLQYGASEGRSPNATFNSDWYRKSNARARDSGVGSFIHYVKAGKRLGYDGDHPTIKGAVPFVTANSTVLLCGHAAGAALFGAERFLLDAIRAYRLLGVNVVVSIPSFENDSYVSEILEHSCVVACIPVGPWRDSLVEPNAAVDAFTRLIDSHGVDLVHCNTIMLQEPVEAASRMQVTCVVHVHEAPAFDADLCLQMGSSAKKIMERVLGTSKFFYANSKFTSGLFKSSSNTVLVAHNVVDIPETTIDYANGDSLVVGVVSSNTPKKGIADFVEIARRLVRHQEVEFRIVGPENEYIDSLRPLFPANIRTVGYQESPDQALNGIHILLSTSQCHETFGRTILEAMARGIPVVSYDLGAMRELIRHGQNGFLVGYRDLEAFAEYVDALIKNRALLRVFGKKGRDMSANYGYRELALQLQPGIQLALSAA